MKLYKIKKFLRKVFTGNTNPFSSQSANKPLLEDLIPLSDNINPLLFGSPLVLCGSIVNGKPNFNTLKNFGILNNGKTPVIYISSDARHYTNIGINENKEFSIGIPDVSIMEKLDYCGKVSGHDTDKSTVFQVKYGELSFAPIITECIVSFSCRVNNHRKIDSMDVFFGDIIERYAFASIVEDGITDRFKIKSISLGPGNSYRVIEQKIGNPWSEYKKVY